LYRMLEADLAMPMQSHDLKQDEMVATPAISHHD
jgi:hypothetical protein